MSLNPVLVLSGGRFQILVVSDPDTTSPSAGIQLASCLKNIHNLKVIAYLHTIGSDLSYFITISSITASLQNRFVLQSVKPLAELLRTF